MSRALQGLVLFAVTAAVGFVGYQVWAGKNGSSEADKGPAAASQGDLPACCGGKAATTLATKESESGCCSGKANLISAPSSGCPYMPSETSSEGGCCGGAGECRGAACGESAEPAAQPDVVKSDKAD